MTTTRRTTTTSKIKDLVSSYASGIDYLHDVGDKVFYIEGSRIFIGNVTGISLQLNVDQSGNSHDLKYRINVTEDDLMIAGLHLAWREHYEVLPFTREGVELVRNFVNERDAKYAEWNKNGSDLRDEERRDWEKISTLLRSQKLVENLQKNMQGN